MLGHNTAEGMDERMIDAGIRVIIEVVAAQAAKGEGKKFRESCELCVVSFEFEGNSKLEIRNPKWSFSFGVIPYA